MEQMQVKFVALFLNQIGVEQFFFLACSVYVHTHKLLEKFIVVGIGDFLRCHILIQPLVIAGFDVPTWVALRQEIHPGL
ncbi:MAG: hypothetical protein HY043_01000 [Verrucomicrobia bacterium]|nr:hypothetical protein [Verrucomicrobiota bacterium]